MTFLANVAQAADPIEALLNPIADARRRFGWVRVWAVLSTPVSMSITEAGLEALRAADGLAVDTVAAAQAVRARGWRGPVLVLHGACTPRDLELCSRLSLWHVIRNDTQIDWLAQHKTHQPHRVFLQLRDGANAPGFAPEASGSAWVRLDALPQVDEISLLMPCGPADRPDRAAAQAAMRDPPGERCEPAGWASEAEHATADWVLLGDR